MADVEIRAKWNGADVKKGVDQMERDMERALRKIERDAERAEKAAAREAEKIARDASRQMAKAAKSEADAIKSVFKGMFGALTVDRAVRASWDAFKDVLHGVAEEGRAYARIQGDLERLGSTRTVGGLGELFQNLDRMSRFTELEIATAFENLVSLTGSVEKAMSLLNLTMDVAIDRRMDLVTASNYMAKVAVGETTALGRLFPNFKNLNRQLEDLQGTSQAAAVFQQELNKTVSGKALEDLKTAAGAWDQLKQSLSELAESSVKAGAVGTNPEKKLNAIAAAVNRIQDGIDRNPKLIFMLMSGYGGWAGLVEAFRIGGGKQAPANGAITAADLGIDTAYQMPFWAPPVKPPKKPKTPKVHDPFWWRQLEGVPERGGIRGFVRESSLPFSEPLEEGKDYKRWSQKFQDDLRKDQEFRDTISSVISDGILSGFQEGGFNGKRVLMSIMDDISQMLLRKGISSIVGSLMLGGATGGAGGLFGGLFGALTGSSGSSHDVGRGPSLNARVRAQELRMARLG